MPKVNRNERFNRVLKFLIASTEPPIAKWMMPRGFDLGERQEGWRLLETAAGRYESFTPSSGPSPTQYRAVGNDLDFWENTWFDVADAALGRLYPTAHGALFKNLSKTSGIAVVLTVKTFVKRLDTLRKSRSEVNTRAMALLEKRGLNAACIDEARTLLGKLETAQSQAETNDAEMDHPQRKAEKDAALDAMWDRYQDWAKTVRTVVKHRNHLVMLGLAKPYRSPVGVDEVDGEDQEDAPAGEKGA